MLGSFPRGSLTTRIAVLAATSLFALGCQRNDVVPVAGRVTTSTGAPIPKVRVIFRKSDSQVFTAQGVTNADGQFDLVKRTEAGGVPAGPYDVLLAPVQTLGDAAASLKLVPARYSTFETSGLKVEVTPEKPNHDFVVK